MIDKIFRILRRWAASAERDRIDAKFDHLDERIDQIEQSNAEIRARIHSMHEIHLANNEALEQKLNASKSGQQQILSIMDLRFSYSEAALSEIKALLTKDQDC